MTGSVPGWIVGAGFFYWPSWLCNRPKEAKFSATLFTYAALPFFALGFAIAVSQVPGVVDWGGGLLALLKAVGLGP